MVITGQILKSILPTVACILLIPLIAMQFTDEVNWTLLDFVVAGILLIGTGLFLKLVLRKVKNRKLRIIIVIFIFITLFIVWAELSVGIFGTPFSGN